MVTSTSGRAVEILGRRTIPVAWPYPVPMTALVTFAVPDSTPPGALSRAAATSPPDVILAAVPRATVVP